jgi:mannosyltransferase OCH1-like enzyme
MDRIPKIIHQIWIQGEENIPEHLCGNKYKITELHPEWQYILWDEISVLNLLKNTNKEWLKNYYKFHYLHQKVDYAKLIIIHIYGGIFIDMDAYAVQKLDSLFNKYDEYDFVVSYVKEINPIANFLVCRRFNKCLNNGIFMGKPDTDILRYMINNITYDCLIVQNQISCIANTTGPVFFDTHIFKYINDTENASKSKILILDNDYFEPCILDICEITENTYIKHEHNLSWTNYYIKLLIELYLNNTLLFHILFLFLFIATLFLLFTYFQINKFTKKINKFIIK